MISSSYIVRQGKIPLTGTQSSDLSQTSRRVRQGGDRPAKGRTAVNDDLLARSFETHRDHLRAVAYRMLGSLSEAEDAVQESWLRLSRSDSAAVENLGGWLTTVVGRVCLDMLRSRKARPECPGDVVVPDPIISRDEAGPEHEALIADSVGLALLVVL